MTKVAKLAKQMVVLFWGLFKDVLDFKVKKLLVTPAIARKLLKLRHPQQRPLRNVSIAYFQRALESGGFYPGSDLSFATCGKRTILLDGNHKLTAVAETGVPALFTYKVYHCKTMAQVKRLYVVFDNGVGYRSKSDMFIALYGKSVLEHLGKKQVGSMISASMMISNCFSQSIARLQTHETMGVLLCAKAFMPAMLRFLKTIAAPTKVRSQTLMYQAILSVALVTMEWKPKQSVEFWDGVAHNGVGANDTRQLLRELLIELQVTRRNPFGQRKGAENFTPNQLSRIVAWCWNKFYTGETPKAIDVAAAASKGDIVIAGTPFSLKRTSKEFAKETASYYVCDGGVDKYVKRSSTSYDKKVALGDVR